VDSFEVLDLQTLIGCTGEAGAGGDQKERSRQSHLSIVGKV
jgi:hypothetical protein